MQTINAIFEILFSPGITFGQITRLAMYLFKTKILRREIIRSVEIIHTLKCNCRCSFCSNEKMSEAKQVMTPAEVYETIDKLHAYGVVAIIFLGGESLTDPEIYNYIRYARSKNLIPLLQSNGSLLTEENIKKLAEAGLFCVTITLQDTIAANHNAIVMKENALETVFAAIPFLKQYKIKIVLKALFSNQTLESGSFNRILAYAKKMNVSLNVNPFMPVGRGVSEKNLLTDNEKKSYLSVTLNELVITTHTKTEYDSQCPAGHLYLGIFPDGEILPCYFLPISAGNIKNTSIREAQEISAQFGIFKKGEQSCIVAMDKKFYDMVIKELYSGRFTLPVRYNENEEVRTLLKNFRASAYE